MSKTPKFKHRNKPQRGIATGIHNAVLARVEELSQKNAALQKILANIVRANDKPLTVNIAPIPGDWVLTMDNAPSLFKGQEAIVLELVTREEFDAQQAEEQTKGQTRH